MYTYTYTYTHMMRIAGWFFGTELKNIRRGNAVKWFAWSLFYKFPNTLTHAEKLELNGLIDHVEQKTGHTFPEGIDLSIKCIRLTLDEVCAGGERTGHWNPV